jgi:hypothetical protein
MFCFCSLRFASKKFEAKPAHPDVDGNLAVICGCVEKFSSIENVIETEST